MVRVRVRVRARARVRVRARARARARVRVRARARVRVRVRVDHDVHRVGEAARDAAGDARDGGAQQQLQRRYEQHPRVLRQLLALERQQPPVEVTELEQVAHLG